MMEQTLPEWLTVSFLDQCIHSKEQYKGLRVVSFEADPALPPGSNFGSFILRARVRVKGGSGDGEDTLSMIIKCPLVTGALSEIFSSSLQDWETIFYNTFLPMSRKLLSFSYAPENFLSPISSVVVLEDLKEAGYLMAKKGEQLDYHQCRCYFVAAANFHAASFGVHKQNPDLVQSIGKERLISNSLEDSMVKTSKHMVRYGLEIMADRLSQSSGDQRVVKILRECSTKLWDILVEVIKPNEKINTLNQGDPWATNMMFRYDSDGNAIEAKLLDFQGPRYTSPVSDLIYFLWTSAKLDVLKSKQEELYQIYLERFKFCLQEMHLDEVLTMETINEHRMKLNPLALMVTEIGPPLILNPSVADITSMFARFREDYQSTDNPYEDMYTEDYCKNHFPRLIEQLQTSGVFDYLEKIL